MSYSESFYENRALVFDYLAEFERKGNNSKTLQLINQSKIGF